MITSLITKSMNCVKFTSSVSLALITLVSGTSAQALQINFDSSFTPHTPEEEIFFAEAMFAIEEAASMWESQLSDPVSVNIDLNFGNLPEGILGGATPSMVKVQYKDVLETLFFDINSFDDEKAFNSLDINPVDFDNSSFALAMNNTTENSHGAGSNTVYLDNNGNENNKTIWMTTANAKALGLIDAHDTQPDGEIRLSDNFNLWNIAQEEGYDLRSAISHEIGHILGFVSGTDMQGFLGIEEDPQEVEENDLSLVSMMDLFRYSEESAAMGVNQIGVNDWTIGRIDGEGNPVDYYFSLDGGQTKIASFANGELHQSAHWLGQDNHLGIMNPTIKPGEVLEITDLDLQLLNAIGWDLFGTSPSFSHYLALFAYQLLFGSNDDQQYVVEEASLDYIMELSLRRARGGSSSTWGTTSDYASYWISAENLDSFLYITGDAVVANAQSAKVPEHNTVFSLLGLGIFGVSSFLKKGNKKI